MGTYKAEKIRLGNDSKTVIKKIQRWLQWIEYVSYKSFKSDRKEENSP